MPSDRRRLGKHRYSDPCRTRTSTFVIGRCAVAVFVRRVGRVSEILRMRAAG